MYVCMCLCVIVCVGVCGMWVCTCVCMSASIFYLVLFCTFLLKNFFSFDSQQLFIFLAISVLYVLLCLFCSILFPRLDRR